MRVVISAGGSGGHIYPALSIINKIKKSEPTSEFLYIGTTDRMEKDIVPKLGIPYVGIELKGISRKNPFKNIPVLIHFMKATSKIKEELKKFHPDIVIGVGGYITGPVISTAKKMGYKTFIHEQNVIPGLTNKYLTKYADKIAVTFADSKKYFPEDKVEITGHPRVEEAAVAKPIDKRSLGLNPKSKLVVLVMGSQGSLVINKKLLDIIPNFKDKKYEILIISGKNYIDMFKDIKLPSNVKVIPYYEDTLGLFKVTDLLVSRSSAGITLETYANHIPSILIPSPHVTDNHQFKNAKELEAQGVSIVLQEQDFNSENLLRDIDSILNDEKKYKKMQENTKNICIKNANTKIYHILKGLLK